MKTKKASDYWNPRISQIHKELEEMLWQQLKEHKIQIEINTDLNLIKKKLDRMKPMIKERYISQELKDEFYLIYKMNWNKDE